MPTFHLASLLISSDAAAAVAATRTVELVPLLRPGKRSTHGLTTAESGSRAFMHGFTSRGDRPRRSISEARLFRASFLSPDSVSSVTRAAVNDRNGRDAHAGLNYWPH